MSIVPPRRTTLVAAGLTALVGAGTGIAASLRADLFDDAFITAVFARRLAAGAGLTWVVGEPAFWGPTSLLQVHLLAAASALGFDLQAASQCLAAITWGAASGLLVLLLESAGPWVAIVAGVSMALSAAPLRLAAGMESGLFAALVVLSLLLQTRSRPRLAGLAAAAATLARPEGLLLFPLLALATVRGQPGSGAERWRRALRALAPGAALLAGAVALAAIFLGSVVPQSLIAKRRFGCDVSGCFSPLGAWRALASALGGPRAAWLLAAAVAGAVAALRDRGSRLLAAWGALIAVAFTVGRAPDSPWYYTSLLPPLYACAAATTAAAAGWRRGLGLVLVGGIVAGNALDCARSIAADPWGRETRWNVEKRRLADSILADMRQRKLREARVLAYEVGYLGWAIPGRVDDLLGLVTPGFQPCLEGRDGNAVLAERRPDYVAIIDSQTYRPTMCIRGASTLATDFQVIASLPTAWGGRYQVWARRPPSAGPEDRVLR